jgi:hypothetical protein
VDIYVTMAAWQTRLRINACQLTRIFIHNRHESGRPLLVDMPVISELKPGPANLRKVFATLGISSRSQVARALPAQRG